MNKSVIRVILASLVIYFGSDAIAAEENLRDSNSFESIEISEPNREKEKAIPVDETSGNSAFLQNLLECEQNAGVALTQRGSEDGFESVELWPVLDDLLPSEGRDETETPPGTSSAADADVGSDQSLSLKQHPIICSLSAHGKRFCGKAVQIFKRCQNGIDRKYTWIVNRFNTVPTQIQDEYVIEMQELDLFEAPQ